MTDAELSGREAMEFDVVIVGAGPAGLAAAIRLKQLSPETSVVVVEKGSEVGAHILSGAVIDPIGMDALIPEWREEQTLVHTAVTDDRFYLLGPSGALSARRCSGRLVCSRSVPSFAPRPKAKLAPNATRRAQAASASALTMALRMRVSRPSSASAWSVAKSSLTHNPSTESPRNSSR